MDANGFIVASALTDSSVGDAAQVRGLLDQVDGELERFTGDGGYDTKGVYDAIAGHQHKPVNVVVPPRTGAAVSTTSSRAARSRNKNVEAIERLGRRRWKKEVGYHQQGRIENTFFRFKRISGGRLRAIAPESQKREALIRCNVLNRMVELGMPEFCSI